MFARMAKGNLTIGRRRKADRGAADNEWRIIREVGAGLSNKESAAALCPVRKARCATIEQHSQQASTCATARSSPSGGADRGVAGGRYGVRSESGWQSSLTAAVLARGGVPDSDGVQSDKAGRAAGSALWQGSYWDAPERELAMPSLTHQRVGFERELPERARHLHERYPQTDYSEGSSTSICSAVNRCNFSCCRRTFGTLCELGGTGASGRAVSHRIKWSPTRISIPPRCKAVRRNGVHVCAAI